MTAPALAVDDVEHRLEGSRLWLRAGDHRVELALTVVGQAAVDAATALVQQRLVAGDTLEQASAVASSLAEIAGRTARRPLANLSLIHI